MVAPPALATTSCDGPRCGPCPVFTAVAKCRPEDRAGAADVVEHLRLQAGQRDRQPPGVWPAMPGVSVSTIWLPRRPV